MLMNELLPLLKGVTGRGNQYKAKCPAHEDNEPSLSIGERDGKILFHCHAGCSHENIIAALGLNMSDLFSEKLELPTVRHNCYSRPVMA